MARANVLCTHALFDEARADLTEAVDAEYWTKPQGISREELLRRVKDKDGLICLLPQKVDEQLLREAPKLRIVANVAVGYDNIDVEACTRRGVAVTNTPGVLDETTADFAWALMMAVARRLSEGEQLARSGNWKGWELDQLCGTDVWGKTLGILGFGRIGRAMARRAAGFQMKVIYHSRTRAPEETEQELEAEYRDYNALLAESDFLSVHVPLNGDTRGMLSAAQFARMKPTAILINTARGPVVDEAALVYALESGKLAGAGLDVYENEPFILPGLKQSNVVLAPHLGSATVETRTKMACIAVANVIALFKEKQPPSLLNPEVWKGH
jgi:glyoxylate reductase